jgi:acetylornithine deacetylase/succinyl-diaminopimelate desuccinylase-like protein
MAPLVVDHVKARGFHVVGEEPDGATLRAYPKVARVTMDRGYPAARTPVDHPALQPAVRAARRAAGPELLNVPTLGGSLPLYLFTETLGAPVVIVPIANHDDHQHAPDENLRLGNLAYGIELFAALAAIIVRGYRVPQEREDERR